MLQARGAPRQNATAKDSEWVRTRQALEKDKPSDVNEVGAVLCCAVLCCAVLCCAVKDASEGSAADIEEDCVFSYHVLHTHTHCVRYRTMQTCHLRTDALLCSAAYQAELGCAAQCCAVTF